MSNEEEKLRLRLLLAQEKQLLDFKDVQLLSGLSSATLHRRISEGALKPIQHVKGGKLLFSKKLINQFIDKGAR